MTVRAEIAGLIRSVNAVWQRCPEPRPPIVADTFNDLKAELARALDMNDEARARKLAYAWADECHQALTSHLLHAPADDSELARAA